LPPHRASALLQDHGSVAVNGAHHLTQTVTQLPLTAAVVPSRGFVNIHFPAFAAAIVTFLRYAAKLLISVPNYLFHNIPFSR